MAEPPQAIEGYGCSCGEKCPTLKEFRSHQMTGNNTDGKGTHRSLGRINMQTGEVTMPPWKDRTPEQKQVSRHGQKTEIVTPGKPGKTAKPAVSQTDNLGLATSLSFIPRVYTTAYTPIMQASQAASIELWGWPKLSLEDFLDTVIHLFFKEKGVILAGYFTNETDEQRRVREEMLSRRGNGGPAPAPAGKTPSEQDVRLLAFQKMVERLANNETITGEDMFNIMEEVSSDAS